MKIRRLEVSGFRGLGEIRWAPGDLNVVQGKGAEDFAAAVFQLATTAGGWSEFGEGIREPVEAPWRDLAGETRWFLACHPEEDGRLDYTQELVIERAGGGPWSVTYERITRADNFEEHELLERRDGYVRYQLEPQALRGRPKPPVPPPQRSNIAMDITALAAVPKFRVDPRVVQHADALAGWMRYRDLSTGPRAPARTLPLTPEPQDVLAPDGRNMVSVLATACGVDSGRKRLDRALCTAIPGYERLAFSKRADGRLGLELVAQGTATPISDLPDDSIAVLLALAPLASTQPPVMLWFDNPLSGCSDDALRAFAATAAEVSAWTQVVVGTPGAALGAALSAHAPVTLCLASGDPSRAEG